MSKGKTIIQHPEYYNKGIEVIEFIESWDLNFSRGNAVKYICRSGVKDPEKEIEDLEKAKQYIQFEIDRLKTLEFDKFKAGNVSHFVGDGDENS